MWEFKQIEGKKQTKHQKKANREGIVGYIYQQNQTMLPSFSDKTIPVPNNYQLKRTIEHDSQKKEWGLREN
jgi:hypothetical protein